MSVRCHPVFSVVSMSGGTINLLCAVSYLVLRDVLRQVLGRHHLDQLGHASWEYALDHFEGRPKETVGGWTVMTMEIELPSHIHQSHKVRSGRVCTHAGAFTIRIFLHRLWWRSMTWKGGSTYVRDGEQRQYGDVVIEGLRAWLYLCLCLDDGEEAGGRKLAQGRPFDIHNPDELRLLARVYLATARNNHVRPRPWAVTSCTFPAGHTLVKKNSDQKAWYSPMSAGFTPWAWRLSRSRLPAADEKALGH